ncbi:MAG: 30S ribosomal protein S12 methylthiotransferase RimO [Cyanobacteria bacterium HKST-UBA06]|nr:30S ribosomal protein S12 methylthiotransferase RimO [Cyanobacteria bacterium HKST-UBA06]
MTTETLTKNGDAPTATHPKTIGYVHLGCPKNLVDTETMLGKLGSAGHRIVGDESQADVVLVNTCSFIDSAQQESVQNLVRLAEDGKKVIITGCLSQKYQSELLDLIPEAHAVVGTGDLDKIVEVVNRVDRGERVISVTQDPTYLLTDDSERMHVTMGSYVYLKIAEGCDYRCSFCIIPSMRGDFRSRSLSSIVDSARRLAEQGVPEVILVGQDTTSWGKDLTDGHRLPDLLRALNDIESLQWIRFMYAYPNLVSDDLLTAMAECDKVVNYLDCPLQHMHPDTLKRMRRPVMDHVAFAQRVRQAVPNVKLRTGLIVGFPGETEAEFEFLLDAVERIRFDRLGVFEYSDVAGAHSQSLENKVDAQEISRRRHAVMTAQHRIASQLNQAMRGQTIDVVVESVDPATGRLTGRSQWDAPEIDNLVIVQLNEGQSALPGQIVPVTVTTTGPYDLYGQLA